MKLLITGGTGFLGKHVAKALYDKNIFPVFLPSSKMLDLTDREATVARLAKTKPTVILHMAALCGGIKANEKSPADFLHKNIDMASNLFYAAHKIGCKKIYTLGSVCAYPKYCPTPFKEDDLWNGYPEETNAPYGMSKRLLLMLQQTYRQQYGIGGAHLIPVNLYGEYDHFDLVNSHVIPALIRKFEESSDVVKCWGTGTVTREFLYAGDAAEAIVKAVLNDFDSPLPINLGTGQDISIADLASLIAKITDFRGKIVFESNGLDGQPKRLLDVSRAKELLDWTAKTSLEEGLQRTINWYIKT